MTPADDLPALPQFPTLIDCLIVADTAHARARKQLEDYVRAYALAARAERDERICGLSGINEDLNWKLASARQALADEVELRLAAEARVKELEADRDEWRQIEEQTPAESDLRKMLGARNATIDALRAQLKAVEARVKELSEKENAAAMCLQSVHEARKIIKEHLGGNCAFLDDDLVRWVVRGLDEIKEERDALRIQLAHAEDVIRKARAI